MADIKILVASMPATELFLHGPNTILQLECLVPYSHIITGKTIAPCCLKTTRPITCCESAVSIAQLIKPDNYTNYSLLTHTAVRHSIELSTMRSIRYYTHFIKASCLPGRRRALVLCSKIGISGSTVGAINFPASHIPVDQRVNLVHMP